MFDSRGALQRLVVAAENERAVQANALAVAVLGDSAGHPVAGEKRNALR